MTPEATRGTRTRSPDGSPTARGRFARWLANWRVALAWMAVRRHPQLTRRTV
jgi:hypothetical protein